MVSQSIIDFLFVCTLIVLLLFFMWLVVQINKRWKRMMEERIVRAISRRRLLGDQFRVNNGYSWDYVIVFQIYDESADLTDTQKLFSMKYILSQLSKSGIEIRLFYSVRKNQVFCKIRAPLKRLMMEAARIDMRLQADPVKLKELCRQGRSGLWDPLIIPDTLDKTPETSMSPWDYVYLKYKYDGRIGDTDVDVANIYMKWPVLTLYGGKSDTIISNHDNPIHENRHVSADDSGIAMKVFNSSLHQDVASEAVIDVSISHEVKDSIFRSADRLKLIACMLNSNQPGGCHLDISQLKRDKCIAACFPLHDVVELRYIQSRWLTFFQLPWCQSTDLVKNYFGEKIGLYFEFLGTYTSYLMIAGLFGFIAWINVATEDNDPSAPVLPYFAIFMCVWATLLLELWRRKENLIAMQWGMIGFESNEQNRPAFVGKTAKSAVTGKVTVTFPFFEYQARQVKTSVLTLMSISGVIACVSFIFFIEISIKNNRVAGSQAGPVIGSMMLALQIQVLNYIYKGVATKLNDYENHRTDTQYEDSLIIKTFLFQFVNSFISFFYTAFLQPFQPDINPCIDNSCMNNLQVMLGTIFISRLGVSNLMELLVPLLDSRYKTSQIRMRVKLALQMEEKNGARVAEDAEHRCDISEVERSFLLSEYDVLSGTFEDYAELAIQFGFTTMFVVAFPLSATLSLISNYVELRVDAWKLCQVFRRPEPRSCEDIGSWYEIFTVLSFVAIFTNAGIVAFTSRSAINSTWTLRMWIFIFMSFGLFSLKVLLIYCIPDVSPQVAIQIQRGEYISSKVIDDIADESPEGLISKTTPKYIIASSDDDPM